MLYLYIALKIEMLDTLTSSSRPFTVFGGALEGKSYGNEVAFKLTQSSQVSTFYSIPPDE